jgi:hypothetical protein
MHDTFEYRDDAKRAAAATGSPIILCPVKWQALWLAANHARQESRTIADMLDQVGLTGDFVPSTVESAAKPQMQPSERSPLPAGEESSGWPVHGLPG